MTTQILRIAPVLLSTASLNFSYNQYLFFKPYLELPPVLESKANAVLGAYVARQFPPGLATIFTLYPLTWAATAANLALRPKLTGASRGWYVAGLAFSVAHMLWGPVAKELMEKIAALDGEDVNAPIDRLGFLRPWLSLHVRRSLLADLPSWVCFGVGYFLLGKRV